MSTERIQSLLERGRFDALVAISPVNVFYLTGARIITQRLIPERLAMVLWPAKSDPSFVVCTIEESLARSESRIRDIRGYVEFKESPIQGLAQVIREKGIERGRIGLEKRYIHAEYFEELTRALPEATFEGCDRDLDRLRAIKSAEEISLLGTAARTTDRAIAAGYKSARLGADELSLAATMRSALFENGAEELTFLCLGAGEHSVDAHHHPCHNKLKQGDIVRVDIGGEFRGYFSDLARTAVVGKPQREQAEAYKALWDVMEEVIAAVKPGVRAKDLYGIYRARFQQRGLAVRMPHIGHSLGIKLHEQPMLMPFEAEVLQPNMVLEIEIVHIDGSHLYHNEDQVVVTESGHEVVSRTRDWSELFQIQ